MNRRRPIEESELQPAPRGFGRINLLAILISAVVFVALGLTLAAITQRGAASLPPTPFPGSGFVISGELDQRSPGFYFTGFKAGASVLFGPGSLVRVDRGLAEMNLPGNYLLAINGTQNAPALIELARGGTFGRPSENTVKLLIGGLVARSGDQVDRRVRLAVTSDVGMATISVTVLGAQYNPRTGVMEIDCIYGSCDVETRSAAAIQLDAGNE